MSCERIAGANWGRARLLFDDVTNGEADDTIDLNAPDNTGVFTGQFRHRDTGAVLADQLMNGRCTPDGLRSRVVFTRKHNGVNVTTRYIGRVIPVGGGSTVVMIRGRFTRATVDGNGTVSIASGDYETEKPT
jgi:hypothetical protein